MRPLSPIKILTDTGQEVELTWTSLDGTELKPNDIELKIVSFDEYTDNYVGTHWKLLFQGKIKKKRKAVIATHKELLRLDAEEFDDELLHWKEESGLTENDWKKIRPKIRKFMEQGFLQEEVARFIRSYVESKTPKSEQNHAAPYENE